MIHNNQQNRNPVIQESYNDYIDYHYYNEWDKNIMTLGRLPESNQNSRMNFRDKANERMQNLTSLPKTLSLPVVSVYQKNNQQDINVVNDMIPINTHLNNSRNH